MALLFKRKKGTYDFKKQLKQFLGFSPRNLRLYENALTHCSITEKKELNNERLEFLGDAVLSALTADYLFKKYPYKSEGFLTEMRSKMVNRHMLNDIALKMNIKAIAHYNRVDHSIRNSSVFGNLLEAIIGALYIDKGYLKTYKWVKENIFQPYLYIDELEQIDINLKNKIYGWASKYNHSLKFETINEKTQNGRKLFTVAIFVDNKKITEATAFNKKEASMLATQLATEKLNFIGEEVAVEN